MKKTFYTPSGAETRDCTQAEIDFFASKGDILAKREVLKKDLLSAGTVAQKIDAILKYLEAV